MTATGTGPGTVGVIANPVAGTDIRRLVSYATPVSDATKIGVIRRVVLGAAEAGAARVLLARDRQALTERAMEGIDLDAVVELVDESARGDRSDSRVAAQRMFKEGAAVVIALGGDGTCRDVASGWLDVVLIPISTGTNNVFPRPTEGTLAGVAAAAIATGTVAVEEAADRMNVITVRVERGDHGDRPDVDEVALVDVALVSERFVGSRAVWDVSVLRELVACIAEPATVGLSAVAGLLHPSPRSVAGGVHVRFGAGRTVRAPIAPGRVVPVEVESTSALGVGERVEFRGPGVLSLDGERDIVLRDGDVGSCVIDLVGPRVVDVERTLALAAARGFLHGG